MICHFQYIHKTQHLFYTLRNREVMDALKCHFKREGTYSNVLFLYFNWSINQKLNSSITDVHSINVLFTIGAISEISVSTSPHTQTHTCPRLPTFLPAVPTSPHLLSSPFFHFFSGRSPEAIMRESSV